MSACEDAVVIRCSGQRMIGVLHRPDAPTGRGVLVVVGGPQYRVGSHRQFLMLARQLALQGIAVLRFDYRGMGDSDGEQRTFEDIQADIRAALDEFFRQMPAMREVVLWGLCDAASAALMYAGGDQRVAGLVVLNPWVRSEATLARTYIRHYYAARLLERDFWKGLFTGAINPLTALRGLASTLRDALVPGASSAQAAPRSGTATEGSAALPFIERMRLGLAGFSGPVLLILSGEDLTAAEFRDEIARSKHWRELLSGPGVTQVDIAGANHTFSRRVWRDQVADCTAQWMSAW